MASGDYRRKEPIISSFFARKAHPGQVKQKVTNGEQMPAKKRKKKSSAKKIVESRGFLQSWLLEFDWLRFNSVSNIMFCDFCQRAGRQMAGKRLCQWINQIQEGTEKRRKMTGKRLRN